MITETLRRIIFWVPSMPKTAQICLTNKCNFSCPMCQRFDLKVDLIDMPFEKYQVILAKLQGVQDIILTGWGEPLLYPDLIKAITLAKEKGFKVRFTSNGALLTNQLIEQLISSKLDAITFSVDEIKEAEVSVGHQVKDQLSKIIFLKQQIDEHKSPMKIYLQSVYMKGKENDIMDVVDFAIKYKLDRVRLTRLDVRFHDFDRPSYIDEKKLIQKIEMKISKTGVGLDFLPHVALDGFAKIIYKLIYPLLHRGGKYCLRTFNDIYVNVNGLVTPCCSLPKLIMGDLEHDDLKNIWQSTKFKEFRKNQKIYCGKCDILSLKPKI